MLKNLGQMLKRSSPDAVRKSAHRQQKYTSSRELTSFQLATWNRYDVMPMSEQMIEYLIIFLQGNLDGRWSLLKTSTCELKNGVLQNYVLLYEVESEVILLNLFRDLTGIRAQKLLPLS